MISTLFRYLHINEDICFLSYTLDRDPHQHLQYIDHLGPLLYYRFSGLVDVVTKNLIPGSKGEPIIQSKELLSEIIDFLDFSIYPNILTLSIDASMPIEYTFLITCLVNKDDMIYALENEKTAFIEIDNDAGPKISVGAPSEFKRTGVTPIIDAWSSVYLYARDDISSRTFTVAVLDSNGDTTGSITGNIGIRQFGTGNTKVNLIRTRGGLSYVSQIFLFKGNMPINEIIYSGEPKNILCASSMFQSIEPKNGFINGICSSKLLISVPIRK